MSKSSDMEDCSSSSSSDKAPIPSEDSKTLFAEDLLECTICLEVPASPIHNCFNGHIICGLCADNVKRCGLCNSHPLQISFFAERLSRQLDFKSKCPNYDSGCLNLVSSTEIKEHIPKCYYRNVICNEPEEDVCKNISVPLKDYPRHLEENHKYDHRLTVRRRASVVNNEIPEATAWQLKFTSKDDQFFLMHNYMGQDAVYFWVTVLADKEEAQKHMYKLTLEKDLNGKEMKSSWTMPVLPYHDYPEFVEPPSPRFVTIPGAVFYEFCEDEVVEEEEMRTFEVSYRIL